MMKLRNSLYKLMLAALAAGLLMLASPPPLAYAQDITQNAQVKTTSAGLAAKVAPGELLPVSVKLLNFGGGKRVDVLVQYDIVGPAGQKILSSSETVAVETTNNFVKTLQLPFDIAEGVYTAKTSITYQGQIVPATTEFSFRVESKILGLFKSDFWRYGGLTALVGLIMAVVGYSLIKRRKVTRFTPFDYSDIPRDERVFYELISDTIMGMRQKVGDQALDVAGQIDGLVVDKNTGRVLKLTGTPSKIVAGLVAGYEKTLGKKVSFSFRGQDKDNN